MPVLKKAVSSAKMSANFIGAESFATWNPGRSFFSHFESDAYASAYPSIRAISNEYKTVMPYAINGKGEKVEHDAVNALYHPNQLDSSVAFFEKIAVSTLALRKTYILVWRREGLEAKPGGDFTRDRIAGYTFLEFPGIERREGRTFYKMGAQEFSDKEVLVLPGGVDPYNLYGGYSPSEASRRWAKLDDYIADYQTGFFENGAVPAGQFLITAATTREYDDIVDKLQERHRGAAKNGNPTYSHRPIDQTTGKPAQAQIEWMPFAQSNKDISLDKIFDQANKRIDLAYGVPQIVKGVDDAATYANAQVAEKGFAKRAVNPLLLSNYTQITHELNRITNGLGVAITYKYDIPTVADEEKVVAETHNIRIDFIKKLEENNYSLESIIDAFELPDSYKLLVKTGEKSKTNDDDPEIDEGKEVTRAPDPNKIDGVTPVNKVKNQLTESDVESYETQLSVVIRDHMQRQVDEAVQATESDATSQTEEPEVEEFTDDMMQIIVSVLVASGELQYPEGLSLLVAAGLSVDDTTSFTLTQDQKDAYREYLVNVAKSYREDTADSVRAVLDRANAEGWNRNELQIQLRNIMNTDEWRVTRLATSEINRSQDMGSVLSMRQIQTESGASIERSLLHTGSDEPCEYCRAFIDKWMPVEDVMIEKGQVIKGADGGELIYSWDNNEGHDVHANGHCVPQYRVAK